jgi:SNF2 family DNA or RNA helicase
MTPFPYQIEGAKFLATAKRALLADDLGLGKSAQAILACDEVGAQHVLVICPASVRENWKREFAKFSAAGIKPVVQSYNNANAINTDPPPGDMWDALILDESHYLKSKDAKRTKAIFGPKCDGVGGLVERAKHVFLLTGTPAPNHAAELWPMLRAVMPESIPSATGRPMPYWSFVSRYCRTRDNGFGIKPVGTKNHEKLREAMSPFVLRRKKKEVLKDLPPIRFDTLAVEGNIIPDFGQEDVDSVALVRKTLAEKGV